MKVVAALFPLLFVACPADDPAPLFPADYLSTYREVRDCRKSADHDLNFIRVLADPVIYDTYVNRDGPFPTGGVLMKEEYDWDDPTCTGQIISFTAAKKLKDGSDPEMLDWTWQRLDPKTRKDVTEDPGACARCHTKCVIPNADNYDYYMHTCALPGPTP